MAERPPTTLTLAEAARGLGVRSATLRAQISRGRPVAERRGRDWHITPSEVGLQIVRLRIGDVRQDQLEAAAAHAGLRPTALAVEAGIARSSMSAWRARSAIPCLEASARLAIHPQASRCGPCSRGHRGGATPGRRARLSVARQAVHRLGSRRSAALVDGACRGQPLARPGCLRRRHRDRRAALPAARGVRRHRPAPRSGGCLGGRCPPHSHRRRGAHSPTSWRRCMRMARPRRGGASRRDSRPRSRFGRKPCGTRGGGATLPASGEGCRCLGRRASPGAPMPSMTCEAGSSCRAGRRELRSPGWLSAFWSAR